MKFFPFCAAAALSIAGFTFEVVAAPPASTGQDTATEFFRHLKSGQKVTVVVYGTSLTHGGAWAPAMKEWFDTRSPGNVTFINSGGPGQNSDWGVQNLKAKVLDHQPDLVLIEFSFNDAHDKFKMPLERGEANLDKMVRAIQAQNAGTCIVLQIMNANWDAPNGSGSAAHRPQLEAFNENYRRYAREHGVILLDHYQAWNRLKSANPKQFQAFVPDGTHPNKEGSLAITWPAIKAWLEGAGVARRPSPFTE
ncbi:MAG: acyl-CoA thioesterase [Chthoniobacter sp.]|jgi:lysophospholipase L1-like esterase|nr:acyl-CoA thioesterase [Chthoniobacter sp.]